MNAKQYADSKYSIAPTFHKIAVDAFKAGAESAKPVEVVKLQNELKEVKAELRSLWVTLEDGEKCSELLAGM